ncbi:trichohyalin-like, partial [Parambassis ranga]|uniref:Trichohyalin-like n=1 Tax=Parambassis ranga TaxID=210632 RepID=A0A6P7JM86_9TELE
MFLHNSDSRKLRTVRSWKTLWNLEPGNMADLRDPVDLILEELRKQVIAGVRAPGTIMEAWMLLTPEEQIRVLYYAAEEGTSQTREKRFSGQDPELLANLEQRQENSKMTQTEEHLKESTVQSEDKQVKADIKTKREAMKRPIQSSCEVIEETQRESSEIDLFKKKTEQQQDKIDRLTYERQELHEQIKRLQLQTENVIEKLQENKNAATQDKTQLLKIQAEIYEESKTLDRRQSDVINKIHKLKIIKYDQTRPQVSKECHEPKQQMKSEQDICERLMADSEHLFDKNKKVLCEVRTSKEQIEKIIANIKEGLKINKNISQNRDQLQHIRQVVISKIKFVKECTEKQKQELDNKSQRTRMEIREMELISSDIEIRKKDLIKMMRTCRRKEDEIRTMKEEIEKAKAGMQQRQDEEEVKREERDDEQQRTPQQTTREIMFGRDNSGYGTNTTSNMPRVTTEEKNPKMLPLVIKDTEEEKSQIKLINFYARKRKRELEHQQEKILKERDELEVMKIKMQQQRQEVEQKLEATLTIMLKMAEAKANIEQTAVEVNNAHQEMLKSQREMRKNKEQVQECMHKLTSMKARVNGWILTQSAVRETFSVNTSNLQEIQTDVLVHQSSGMAAVEEEAQHRSTKVGISLYPSISTDSQHQSEETDKQVHKKAMENICLQIQTEMHEEKYDDQTELLINANEKEKLEKQIHKLKQHEKEIKDQIKYAMENMEEKSQEIKRLIREINDLQCQRPEVTITIGETENVNSEETELPKEHHETEHPKKAVCEKVSQKTEGEQAEILKLQIRVERSNVRILRQEDEAAINEMNSLRENIDRQKQELDDKMQRTKKEIREMELLKSEMEIKKKESERMFRKSMRKIEQSERIWNEIQQEEKSLRRETKKRRKELDQRLEKNIRVRDEIEVLRIKLNRQKEELAEENLHVKDQKSHKSLPREHDKQSLESKSYTETEMIHQSSQFIDFIVDFQNMRKKIHEQLEMIRTDMATLGNIHVHLERQREALKELEAGNINIKDSMRGLKSQIKMDENVIRQARTEEVAQNQEVYMTLQKVTRERREMEVLLSELEIKKRENKQIVRKGIQKEQEAKHVLTSVQEERAALKRETQKKKKELDQRLERIIKERDELEIVKLKLHREQNEKKGGITELQMSAISEDTNQIQKQCDQLQKCTEKYEDIKTHSEVIKELIEEGKTQLQVQTNIFNRKKEEVMHIRMGIKSQKNLLANALKRIKQTEMSEMEMEKREKMDLELLRSDIQKQMDMLEHEKETIKEEKSKMEITRTEMQNRKEHADTLFDEILSEKENNEVLKRQLQTQREKLEDIVNVITSRQKEQERNNEEVKRQREELETIKKSMEAARQEVEDLRKTANEKKAEADAAMKSLNEDKELVSQMKIDIDKEREILLSEKDRIEGERSDLRMTEDQLIDKMRAMEILRVKLKDLSVKMREGVQTKMAKLQQNTEDALQLNSALEENLAALNDQKENMACYTETLGREKEALISLLSDMVTHREVMENEWKKQFDLDRPDLDKLATDLKKEREVLDRETEVLNREKMDLELLRSDIQKQMDMLEQEKETIKEEKNKMEITRTEMQNRKEHADTLFDEILSEKENNEVLKRQLQTQREKLEDIMNVITSRQKEQERNNEEVKRQREELETIKKSMEADRQEVEDLRKTANEKKAEADAAMKSLNEDKELVSQMKIDIDKEREILVIEKDRIEGERSDLRMTEDQLIDKMRAMEILRVKLNDLSVKMREGVQTKMAKLQQNTEDALQLHSTLEENLAALNDQKENMASYTETLGREKEALISLLSDMVTHREVMENEWKKQFDLDRPDLDKLATDLKKEREVLDRESEVLNREKMDLELLRSDIQKQMDMLEQEKETIKEEKNKMEITRTEMQNRKEHADTLFDEILSEKEE